MRSLRSLFGEPLDGANRMPVFAAEVAVRAVFARIEAEAPRAVVVARVRDGRPEVAVRTGSGERKPSTEAGAGKEDTGGNIISSTTNNIPIRAVHCRQGPVALVAEVIQFLLRRHAPFPTPMYLRRIMLRGQHPIFSRTKQHSKQRYSFFTLNNPPLAQQCGQAFAFCWRMFLIECKGRRGTVTRHPNTVLEFVTDRVTPPEVETVIFRILRADVRLGPVRTTLPELDFVVA